MTANISRRKILIVDDHEDFALLVRKVLELDGATVTVVRSGLDALTLSVSGFDLILMDLSLPDMTGFEVTRRLRQSGYRGPILCISAHAMPSDARAALLVGCNEHIAKPLSLGKLREAVARHLELGIGDSSELR